MDYFRNEQNKASYNAILRSWLGVSYFHMGASRGGVDCTKFVGLTLVELGILTEIENCYYSKDWYIHGTVEVILGSIAKCQEKFITGFSLAQFVWEPEELVFGDLCAISLNKRGLCNHVAIFIGNNEIIHCLQKKGVFICDFNKDWRSHTKYVYRLIKE